MGSHFLGVFLFRSSLLEIFNYALSLLNLFVQPEGAAVVPCFSCFQTPGKRDPKTFFFHLDVRLFSVLKPRAKESSADDTPLSVHAKHPHSSLHAYSQKSTSN